VATSSRRPETGARSFLADFPGWAADARTVLAALGIVLYAVLLAPAPGCPRGDNRALSEA
jgi:hypothetical protein